MKYVLTILVTSICLLTSMTVYAGYDEGKAAYD